MLQEVPFLMIDLASHLIVVFRAFNKTKNHPILLGAHYLPRPTSRHILWGVTRVVCSLLSSRQAVPLPYDTNGARFDERYRVAFHSAYQ